MPIIRIQGDNERRQGIYYEVDTDAPALGAGGMGQVFRGVRVDRNGERKDVAIKFLFDDLPQSAIERSRREAGIQIHNENLVEMFGFIEVPDPHTGAMHYHVVSELLEGVMLYDLLEGKTSDAAGNIVPLACELYILSQSNRKAFATRIVKAVLSGVMAMHDLGYVHRDIDPSNIMVTQEGRIKLIDFGIAKNLNADVKGEHKLTSVGQFMGKAAYAAPELITGDVPHQDATTDIYAIGIMLFQLLVGELPFDGPQHEVANMQMGTPMPLKKVEDKEMRKVVDHATRKKQAERYISAAEMRVDLERAERGLKTSSGTTPGTTISLPDVNTGKWLKIGGIAFGAIALLIVAGIGIWHFATGSTESLSAAADPETEQVAVNNPSQSTTIPSVSEALEMLNDASKVKEAVEALQSHAKDKNVEAIVALARIYAHDLDEDVNPKIALEIPKNGAKTVEYLNIAKGIHASYPKVLLLEGDVYFGGPGYTGELVERDLEKALGCYRMAYQNAQEVSDMQTAARAKAKGERIAELLNTSFEQEEQPKEAPAEAAE